MENTVVNSATKPAPEKEEMEKLASVFESKEVEAEDVIRNPQNYVGVIQRGSGIDICEDLATMFEDARGMIDTFEGMLNSVIRIAESKGTEEEANQAKEAFEGVLSDLRSENEEDQSLAILFVMSTFNDLNLWTREQFDTFKEVGLLGQDS